MATQLLNAGPDVVTIQGLLGHSKLEQIRLYSKLSNMKAPHDYYQAMERILENKNQTMIASVPPVKN